MKTVQININITNKSTEALLSEVKKEFVEGYDFIDIFHGDCAPIVMETKYIKEGIYYIRFWQKGSWAGNGLVKY